MVGMRSLWALLQGRGRHRHTTGRYQPVLHGLEDRCLLSTFHEYLVPDSGHGVYLSGITAGPDGNVWFTYSGTDAKEGAVGSITPDGTVTEFPQSSGYVPYGIVSGADDNLWYGGYFLTTDMVGIGRLATDGTATLFPIPDFGGADESVVSVTLGPNGNVWYGQNTYLPGDGAVGEITPDGQANASLIPHDDLGGQVSILDITTGPDGNLWFVPETSDSEHLVGRVTPDKQFTFFHTPGPNDELIGSITAGPDGNVWAPAAQGDGHSGQLISASIDQITPDGQFTEFPLADPSHRAGSITLGPDGNLWFTEPNVNQIGMMTPDGQFTEYTIPTPNSSPGVIAAGPDGNLWFTETASGQIGEFVLNDTGSATSASRAQAVRSAAVDGLFAGAQPDPLKAVVVHQQPAPAAVDTTFAARRLEALPTPKPQQAVADAGTMPHQHQGDRAEPAAAGLADPLVAGLVFGV